MMAAGLFKLAFPIRLVCQRVGVGAPEFLYHLALQGERAFCLGLLVGVVQRAEGELRAGHQGGLAGLLIQLLRAGVRRAEVFGFGVPQGVCCGSVGLGKLHNEAIHFGNTTFEVKLSAMGTDDFAREAQAQPRSLDTAAS